MTRHAPTRRDAYALIGLSRLATTGCTGPDALFSIGQNAVNATVMTFVSTLWTSVINGS